MPIPVTLDQGVALVRLENGRGNAIDFAIVDALHAAIDEVERTDARSVVVTAQGRVFCGGLDLLTAHAFDRPTLERFVLAFDGLFRRVFTSARPVVAAVNGHALAGGCILAMACDLRVISDGPYQIGVNEVQLGIPFPPATFEIARRATPAPARTAVLLQGKRLSPAEAHRAGLVHRLAPDGEAVAAAREEAALLASAGPDAVRAVKADLIAPALARIDASFAGPGRRASSMLWFSPEAQARIGALRDALAAKQKPGGAPRA